MSCRLRFCVCVYVYASPLHPPTIPCLVPLSLSLIVSLTTVPSSSFPQKHSFVHLSRFPAEVWGLRSPLQSGSLSGAVPAAGEALCRPAVEPRERPTWWISELLWEADTKTPESANKNRWPLSHFPTPAHLYPLSVCAISTSFRLRVFPVLVFLVVCCSWINLHFWLNVQEVELKIAHVRLFLLLFNFDSAERGEWIKALYHNESFIPLVAGNAAPPPEFHTSSWRLYKL